MGSPPHPAGLPPRTRRRAGALGACLLAGLALAVAGCGGDGEDRAGTNGVASDVEPTAPATETAPSTDARTEAESPQPGGTNTSGGVSPEDRPGGAGDEVPASSQALFTGRAGRIGPRLVQVPPFIAIRAELRSADGVEYTLRGGGRVLRAGGEVSSASTTFDGLRAGRRIVLTGPAGRVVIEASAEPGP